MHEEEALVNRRYLQKVEEEADLKTTNRSICRSFPSLKHYNSLNQSIILGRCWFSSIGYQNQHDGPSWSIWRVAETGTGRQMKQESPVQYKIGVYSE